MMTVIFALKNLAYYLHSEYHETLHKEEYQQGRLIMQSYEIGKSEQDIDFYATYLVWGRWYFCWAP